MQINPDKGPCGGVFVLNAQGHDGGTGRESGADMRMPPGHAASGTNGAAPGKDTAFWEAALRALGHVSIFAFATGDFMVIGPGGMRVRGNSLTTALRETLRCLGFEVDGGDKPG
ncbi:hypothetical protein [Paraburkholderia sp. J63]|uniref:hypothetical protein n=1 Tax=Paraburkholderia sp. J63 TaxID=2805434 RepID=UPI002ABDCA6C|nr:hypothetical protein [Paraburkholderia sp. J63]